MTDHPKLVLFACVHNSGRSRMAEAFFNDAVDRLGVVGFRAISAGTEPADAPNPAVVEVMAEIGLRIPNEPGRLLVPELFEHVVRFIGMGCGDADACPISLYRDGGVEDWDLRDPKGKGPDDVRAIRDDIRQRVTTLIGELA